MRLCGARCKSTRHVRSPVRVHSQGVESGVTSCIQLHTQRHLLPQCSAGYGSRIVNCWIVSSVFLVNDAYVAGGSRKKRRLPSGPCVFRSAAAWSEIPCVAPSASISPPHPSILPASLGDCGAYNWPVDRPICTLSAVGRGSGDSGMTMVNLLCWDSVRMEAGRALARQTFPGEELCVIPHVIHGLQFGF